MAPLVLSVSQVYSVRLPGVTYRLGGAGTDPRVIFTPQFQLAATDPSPDEFGPWAAGEWEEVAPPGGPYAATVLVGPGEDDPVNPGVVGVYRLYARMEPITLAGETPTFRVGVIELTTP